MQLKQKLSEEDAFVPTRKNKTGKKATCKVVISEVNVRRSSSNLTNPKSFQSRATRKSRMVDKEQCSNDVLTCIDFYYAEPS